MEITRDKLELWRAKAIQISASPSGLSLSDDDRRLLCTALLACVDVLYIGGDEPSADPPPVEP